MAEVKLDAIHLMCWSNSCSQ